MSLLYTTSENVLSHNVLRTDIKLYLATCQDVDMSRSSVKALAKNMWFIDGALVDRCCFPDVDVLLDDIWVLGHYGT